MKRVRRAVLAVGLGMLGAVGWVASAPGQGAAPSTAPMASEAEVLALKERAAAFWAARVAGDIEAQWQLLEPRWKGIATAAEYGSGLTGGRWLAYQIEGVTINGLFATVKVRMLIQQILPPSAASHLRARPTGVVADDAWIRIRGVWYRNIDSGQSPSQTAQP